MNIANHVHLLSVPKKPARRYNLRHEVLKTNNLMEKEDFPGFMAAASHLDGSPDDLINAVEQRYRKLAGELGVTVPARIV
jgi:hypothetical protein